MSFKEGDKVKFHVSYGWNGGNPWFYGDIVKDKGKLKIKDDEFDDSPFPINDKYIENVTKLKTLEIINQELKSSTRAKR